MEKSEDILAVVGPRRAPIVVRLNEYNGRRTVDFRRYFYPKDKEDLVPTQKGVSFDRESFSLIQSALNENRELISLWLDQSTSATTLSANAQAVEQLQSELRPHMSQSEDWKSPIFFHVGAEGAVDRLTLNSSHPLYGALEALSGQLDKTSEQIVRDLITAILISYYRSKMLFDGVREMVPREIFETLEINWGIILKKYAERIENNE